LTLQNEHASLNNRFSRLDAEARKQHAELDRQLRDERSMNLELQALIDRVQPDLNRLETALQSARHELQTQRSGSARLQVELENAVLSGQLEASRAADLQLEMDAVRRDNIRLRDECSTATSKLRKMEENFKEGASSQQARMPCAGWHT
jgi:chromosome segregation ATPase